jgi:hypothetical protein
MVTQERICLASNLGVDSLSLRCFQPFSTFELIVQVLHEMGIIAILRVCSTSSLKRL